MNLSLHETSLSPSPDRAAERSHCAGNSITAQELEFAVDALLPKSLRERLRACRKRPHKGVHQWLIETAVRLHHYIGDQDIIATLLTRYSANCGRDVDDTEIWNAIWDSERWLGDQTGGTGIHERAPKWHAPDESRIAVVVRNGRTLSELKASS